MSTQRAPSNKKPRKPASPAKKKAAKKSRKPAAKKAARKLPPQLALPPNSVVIPYEDALMGKQFNANVNCKVVPTRTGKTRKKCDRQRLTVVGGASPSAERPRAKQLFAVQVGQRYTVPDREIRRDLRGGERVRRMGDAAEPSGPVDTSFDFKDNGLRRFAIRSKGIGVVAFYDATDSASALAQYVADETRHGVPRGFDARDYLAVPAAKPNGMRKANHHGGYHAPGDPLGVYMPPLESWRSERGMLLWAHPKLPLAFWVYKPETGGGVGIAVTGRGGAMLFQHKALNRATAFAALKAWYATHGDAHRKPNRAPKGAVAGQTFVDRRADPLAGRRVSGENYYGEVRSRAVGCDGRSPAHIVGGHIMGRSRVNAAVRRDERLAALRAAAPIVAMPEAPIAMLPAGPSFSERFGAGAMEERRPLPVRPSFSERFGAGAMEERRPLPVRGPAQLADDELARIFREEMAKAGFKVNGRRRASWR